MFTYLFENHHLYALFKVHWMLIIFAAAFLYKKYLINAPLYPVTNAKKFYFITALTLLFFIKATPVDVIGTHYLFSVHVSQMSITYFIVVPLLILSFPTNFLRRHLWDHKRKLAMNIFAHPWLTLVSFNGLLTLYLIPTVFNYIHTHFIIVFIVQVVLFLSAVFMWWAIIQPVPEIKGFDHLMRALYIFLASVALFPIGFFYVIILTAHFPMYIDVAEVLLPGFTAIYDQQAAGGILKIIQLASYALALLLILLQWNKKEEEKDGIIDDENIRYVRGVVIHLDKNRKK